MTIAEIEVALKRFGWSRYKVYEQEGETEGYISAQWFGPTPDDSYTIEIDPIPNADLVVFTVRNLAVVGNALPAESKLKALNRLLSENSKRPLGAFALRPDDGELMYRLAMPSKAIGHLDAFNRCIEACRDAAESCGAGVFGVLEPSVMSSQPAPTKEVDTLMKLLLEEQSRRKAAKEQTG